ncbi:MAG: hypothetical protein ACE5I1_08815 [bacterium]
MPANSQNNGKRKEKTNSETLKRVEEKLDRFGREQEGMKVTQNRFEEKLDRFEENQKRFGERQQRFEERLDRFDERQERFDERQQRFEERLDRFDERQERFDERQERFDERQERTDARLDNVAREVRQNTTAIENLRNTVLNLYAKQEKRAEEEQRKNAEFREKMLSLVDYMRAKYDDFDIEKKALGASDERLQKDVDGLKASDKKQNLAIANLETRVDRIESDQASA